MIFKIYYVVHGTPDYFIVSGDTVLEVQAEVKIQLACRGIDPEKTECWSEEI